MAVILDVIISLLYIYYAILVIYILLSWVTEIRGTKFYSLLDKICDPFLRIFRGKLIVGMIDLGTMLGLIGYYLVIMLLQSI